MLDAAQRRMAEGQRVFVGCLQMDVPDPQLDSLLRGLALNPAEVSPVLHLDDILSTRPDLVIVDDLPAINPVDFRHTRRFEDVLEVLDRGIDVFTTMDISQLESLRDESWQCDQLKADFMVPDRIFDRADVIEFVDVSPDELIHRLDRIPALNAKYPAERFADCFTLERLTLMRETALRRVAGRIQSDYRNAITDSTRVATLPAQNRILVCISSHPLAERLVRAGRRMADELNAGWVAIYIETPDRIGFSYPHTEQLEKNLALASELGAEVVRVSGHHVADAVLDYARSHSVTRIILGNPRRKWWQDFLNTTLVDQIIRQSGMIDVYVISDERGIIQSGVISSIQTNTRWPAYLKAVLIVLLATAISLPLHLAIEPVNLVMIYLAAVVFSAVNWGRGPSLLASFVSAFVFDFFLIDPRLSLTVADTQYLITLVGFLIIAVVISNLASTIRVQVEESRLREARTNALYHLSRNLATALDTRTVYETILQQVGNTFHREAALVIHEDQGGNLYLPTEKYLAEPSWQSAVDWSLGQGQPAGFGASAFPTMLTHFHPLIARNSILGVLCVQFLAEDRLLSTEKRQVLDAYTAMAALAIERAQLADQANQTRLAQEKEKLQTTLLNSISHDLRTPLATITGVLSTLHETDGDQYDRMDREIRAELIDTGWEEADRLNRLVGNLLDITRLEAGAVRLKLVEVDLVEVIGSVRNRMKDRLDNFDVIIDLEDDLPSGFVDVTLVEQVMVNLLDNAIKFSQPGGKITISGRLEEERIMVTVSDQGEGIPPAEIDHIFDKFFRGKSHERMSGTGLGLAICKGLVEIHGGTISARNLPEGGAAFSFDLPIRPLSEHGEEA